MIYLLSSLILVSTLAYAEIAKVTTIYGEGKATLYRNGQERPLSKEELLETNDEIQTTTSTVIIHLYPSGQIAIAQNSRLKLNFSQINGSEKEEIINSAVDLMKGMIRLKIDRESNQKINQQVTAGDATFGVRGTDFEVSYANDEVDLDVYEGEVEFSSPQIQTFVPEILKKDEGLSYQRKQKKYQRRKFKARLKEIKFSERAELKQRWKKMKGRRQKRRS